MTPWDRRALVRAAAASIVAWALCVLVVAATDEGGVPWAARLGRALPTAPLAAALGAGLVLARARSRGELRALEAAGQSASRSAYGPVIGGVLPAALLSALALAAVLDISSFFPRPGSMQRVVRADRDSFLDAAAGLRISPDGAIAREGEAASLRDIGQPQGARLAVAAAVLGASIALALATARPPGLPRRAWMAVAGLAALASLGCFQLAAVARAPAWLAIVPHVLVALALGLRSRQRTR
jgi:hypothetical protein